MMRLRYTDSRHGQIHLRQWSGPDGGDEPMLVCLHPIPYSGSFFETIAPRLAQQRPVAALDYPGYGGSPRPDQRLSIAQLAEAVLDCLTVLNGQQPFDMLGFHTGCLVAVDAARQASERVSRLMLVDVPLFDPADRKRRLQSTPELVPLSSELSALEPAWAFNVTRLSQVSSLERAHQMLLEQLRAGPQQNWGFISAFEYAAEDQLSAVLAPALLLATASPLAPGTRRAAAALPDARLVELPQIQGAAFEAHAEEIAAQINRFVSGPA